MLGRNSGVVGGKTPLRDLQGRHKMSDIMTRKIMKTTMLMGHKKKATVSDSTVCEEDKEIQSKWSARCEPAGRGLFRNRARGGGQPLFFGQSSVIRGLFSDSVLYLM